MEKKLFATMRLDVGRMLFEIGAIKTRDQSPDGKGFRLALHDKNPTAPLSPIYANLRTVDNPKPGPLTSEHVDIIAGCLYHLGEKTRLSCDQVVGIPRAGQPFATSFLSFFKMKTQAPSLLMLSKGEGRTFNRTMGGLFAPGDSAVLIEDTMTTASSCLEAIAILNENGLRVTDVLAVIDREQGGSKKIRSLGITFNALFTIRTLLAIGLESRYISQPMHKEILEYLVINGLTSN